MIITSAEQLRALTGSYYQNNDYERIRSMVEAVEQDTARTVGLTSLDTLDGEALLAAQTAVAYMAVMRHYRLNDLSHEDAGRKAKLDRENEARPFEWQLARDERAHLDEYYRALDRLVAALADNTQWKQTRLARRIDRLIIRNADALHEAAGIDPSPWLFIRLVPFLAESQRHVRQAYGQDFDSDIAEAADDTDELVEAAQRAVALGALAIMGRRTSLQTLPYALMKAAEHNGGGNAAEQPAAEQLDDYLKHLSREQHYWLNEMRTLRDIRRSEGAEAAASYLVIPENERTQKFLRL